MENKSNLLPRLFVLLLLVLLCVGIAAAQLYSLQIKNGEEHVKAAAVNLTTSANISAARGEILDRYGRELVTNQAVYSISLLYSAWEQEGQFERILQLANLVEADGGKINDSLPISKTAPFVYEKPESIPTAGWATNIITNSSPIQIETPSDEQAIKWNTFQEYIEDSASRLEISKDASPDVFLSAMRAYLKLPESFSEQEARTVIGIYYSMRNDGFNMQQSFRFASDISIDLIAIIKENHQQFAGVEIATGAGREYQTELAAHILGTVGPMFAEDWDEYKSLGYQMSDIVGKSGLEFKMEEFLHGSAGASAVDTMMGSIDVSEYVGSYAPKPGDNVITTLDIDLQQATEQALADYIAQYGYGGAAVVLDANTSEVLAMASYPTYQLETYNENYSEIQADSRKPEYNRATLGTYAPGSTFKILTSIAALEEGYITPETTFTCNGYIEYGGQRFDCTGEHGTIALSQAIKYSCNVYFYEVGKLIKGEGIEDYCKRFGLGELTKIEIAETKGQAAGPTSRAAMREADPTLREWQGGDDVQAAIGQSDHSFTPLQLANYLAAVVNGGTLHQPTLIKSIKSYDYGEIIKDDEPVILNTIEMADSTYNAVMEGMGEVTAEGGTAASTFADYPIKIGGKTGTVQTNVEALEHGTFIAFAPYDNPEIVISVVGEAAQHGSSVAPVVRDILNAYFKTAEAGSNSVQKENAIVL